MFGIGKGIGANAVAGALAKLGQLANDFDTTKMEALAKKVPVFDLFIVMYKAWQQLPEEKKIEYAGNFLAAANKAAAMFAGSGSAKIPIGD